MEELATLDDSEFNMYKYVLSYGRPIYGLIFLFKWSKKLYKTDKPTLIIPDMFFANQVISNACATQAIISILLNLKDIDIGDILRSFKDFAMGLDPKVNNNKI